MSIPVSEADATPAVSVIMPAFNTEKYLRAAVQSILDQTFTDFELLIIDDGSTDDTAQIATALAATDRRICVITNPKNLGVSVARNIGIKAANAPLIALQDADDLSTPERFKKQIAFMEANPDVAVVSPNRISFDANGTEKNHRPMPARPTWQSMKKRNEIVCTATMIRKSVLDEVGGFNEFFVMAEDYELWLRIVKKHSIANLSDPLCKIRVHSQSTTGGGKGPADLARWRMLALAVADDLVTPETVQRYYETGIATFATEMPIALKEEYLTHLAAGLKNAKQYKQSLATHRELKNLTGWNWKVGRNIAKMWFKSRGR